MLKSCGNVTVWNLFVFYIFDFFAQDWLNIFSCDKFLHSYHETKIIANQLISCPSFPYL